ncbi:MAG: hypothetical protein AAFZ46_07530, partial [Pseudomonadota bacterium]
TLDVDRYQSMLDAPEMADEQKNELIEALWTFVVCFMDLGYKIQPLESCGQSQTEASLVPNNTDTVVCSVGISAQTDFAKVATSKEAT